MEKIERGRGRDRKELKFAGGDDSAGTAGFR
jgi:hypothetical protein